MGKADSQLSTIYCAHLYALLKGGNKEDCWEDGDDLGLSKLIISNY